MIDTLAPSDDAAFLNVTWQAGGHSALPADMLRRAARDAWTRRELIDHGEVRVKDGIRITGVYPVGAFGVNVHFSDGHEKAIYPFPYLRELSRHIDK
ncbi:DUF971 domain-containing protein [Actibacterium ureilyticum]|uniref:DUF971 domain-containing protein n=1 Tax=Actibacterium ureilyticum TaxID=1590614 RepID=UPI000BAAA2BB|nr:DUF971 domain-containing protein [Actibacterium ureilyticum]